MKELFRELYQIRSILIVVLTPIVLLPLPLSTDGQEAKCAYAIIIMAVYWITEALPIAVTALLPVCLFPMVGLMSVKETSKQYINDTNMISLGSFIVAAALEHWNIHRRIALKMLLLVGAEPKWLMFGLMAPTWFLSMWMSNTTTTTMMIPMAHAILLQLKETDRQFNAESIHASSDPLELEDISIDVKQSHREANENNALYTNKMQTGTQVPLNGKVERNFNQICKAFSLSIAYAANVGGISSLTGTKPNLVFKGQLDIIYEKLGLQSPVTFTSWMAFGVPTSFVIFLLVWFWLQVFFLRCSCFGKRDEAANKRVKEFVAHEYKKLGPITFAQGAVIVHFFALALLWITREMGGTYGWSVIFPDKYVKDAVPAMLISTLLFIFPSKLPAVFNLNKRGNSGTRLERVEPLLTWNVAVHKVPWGLIFLLGGGFAMAHASEESGLSRWVGSKLIVFESLDPWVLNLVLCYIVAAMTEVTSNAATCTLMMPILANLAIALKLNPMYLMFPAAIATSFAFMLPVATGANAVVFSYGYVKVVDMVKVGFILNIVCVLFLVASIETLGEHLFSLHTVPDIIMANVTSNHTSYTDK